MFQPAVTTFLDALLCEATFAPPVAYPPIGAAPEFFSPISKASPPPTNPEASLKRMSHRS